MTPLRAVHGLNDVLPDETGRRPTLPDLPENLAESLSKKKSGT
jgi:hypothetical protein